METSATPTTLERELLDITLDWFENYDPNAPVDEFDEEAELNQLADFLADAFDDEDDSPTPKFKYHFYGDSKHPAADVDSETWTDEVGEELDSFLFGTAVHDSELWDAEFKSMRKFARKHDTVKRAFVVDRATYIEFHDWVDDYDHDNFPIHLIESWTYLRAILGY